MSLVVVGLEVIASNASHKQTVDILSAAPIDARVVDTVRISADIGRVVIIKEVECREIGPLPREWRCCLRRRRRSVRSNPERLGCRIQQIVNKEIFFDRPHTGKMASLRHARAFSFRKAQSSCHVGIQSIVEKLPGGADETTGTNPVAIGIAGQGVLTHCGTVVDAAKGASIADKVSGT